MSEVADSILQGLNEALEFAKGKETGAVVHIPDEIDVQRIRKKMNMTQASFANYFGFKIGTLRDWEQGRRVPEAPTRALLCVIDKEPEAVHRALVV